MNKKMNEELQALVDKATAGDKNALETLITGVQDIVFNLSLRMLGTFADAEDATQDFSFCKPYQSPKRTRQMIQEFLDSTQLSIIQKS